MRIVFHYLSKNYFNKIKYNLILFYEGVNNIEKVVIVGFPPPVVS